MAKVKKMTPKTLRTKKRMFQYEVAKKIGIDKASYCLKENGKRPWTLREFSKLAKFYGVSIADLKI